MMSMKPALWLKPARNPPHRTPSLLVGACGRVSPFATIMFRALEALHFFQSAKKEAILGGLAALQTSRIAAIGSTMKEPWSLVRDSHRGGPPFTILRETIRMQHAIKR